MALDATAPALLPTFLSALAALTKRFEARENAPASGGAFGAGVVGGGGFVSFEALNGAAASSAIALGEMDNPSPL